MPGVVIELKAAEDETEDLAALAEETRRQIDTREYTTEMLAGFDHFPPHIPDSSAFRRHTKMVRRKMQTPY